MQRIVIVGAGLAGHKAAIAARQLSKSATIALIGSEPGLPYDRPPLSKALLLGECDAEEIFLPDAARYSEIGIEYYSGTTVKYIDKDSLYVVTNDGRQVKYDKLLITTGSRPRRLPFEIDHRIKYLRTLPDALSLRNELRPRGRLAIIGGGFIGLEVAAAASAKGCAVTVIEVGSHLLARGLPPIVGHAVASMHRQHGVRVLLDCKVADVTEGSAGNFLLETSVGSLEADFVLAGIGVTPNVELALQAGLVVDDGIVVDAGCRTSCENIYAAGDVTAFPMKDGTLRRVESWKVAAEQSLVAVRNMLGMPSLYATPPWFWSDQYDANIQVIGQPANGTRFLLKGSMASSHWTLVALNSNGVSLGAVSMNNGRDISMMRRAIQAGAEVPIAFASEAREIKDMDSVYFDADVELSRKREVEAGT